MSESIKETERLKRENNAKVLGLLRQIKSWQKINLHKVEEVKKRVEEYYNVMLTNEERPTPTGLALALGISLQKLKCIMGGTSATKEPEEVIELLCGEYSLLEAMLETFVLNNKVQPVNGIFLMKNQFGYKDQAENIKTINIVDNRKAILQLKEKYNIEDAGKKEKEENIKDID